MCEGYHAGLKNIPSHAHLRTFLEHLKKDYALQFQKVPHASRQVALGKPVYYRRKEYIKNDVTLTKTFKTLERRLISLKLEFANSERVVFDVLKRQMILQKLDRMAYCLLKIWPTEKPQKVKKSSGKQVASASSTAPPFKKRAHEQSGFGCIQRPMTYMASLPTSQTNYQLDPRVQGDYRKLDDHARGLINGGNTCFLNSVLQSLMHTHKFQEIIENCPEHSAVCQCLICDLKAHILQSFDARFEHIPLYSPVTHKIKEMIPGYKTGRQEDAAECLQGLFTCLTTLGLDSELKTVFGSTMTRERKCCRCPATSNTNELMMQLEIGINFLECENVSDSLHYFTDHETLTDFKCESETCCGAVTPSKRLLEIGQYPQVLMLQLKRFDNYQEKLENPISFKEYLDIQYFMTRKNRKEGENTKIWYRLCAVIMHKGHSLRSGHYISYIRGKESGKWWRMDDETVRMADFRDIGINSQTVYMLIYENCDLHNIEIQEKVNMNSSESNLPWNVWVNIFKHILHDGGDVKQLLSLSRVSKAAQYASKDRSLWGTVLFDGHCNVNLDTAFHNLSKLMNARQTKNLTFKSISHIDKRQFNILNGILLTLPIESLTFEGAITDIPQERIFELVQETCPNLIKLGICRAYTFDANSLNCISLREFLDANKTIEQLNFSGNRLSDFSNIAKYNTRIGKKWEHLKVLDISDTIDLNGFGPLCLTNNLYWLIKATPNLVEFRASNSSILVQPSWWYGMGFNEWSKLQLIDLSRCQFDIHQSDVLQFLQTFSRCIGNLPNLEVLDVSGVDSACIFLTFLHPTTTDHWGCSSLKVLNLAHCSVNSCTNSNMATYFQRLFMGSPKLNSLNLSGINRFPASLQKIFTRAEIIEDLLQKLM